jgi:pilus assembly protein CpaE
MSDRIRIFLTGDCDGFGALGSALAEHPELEVVGSSEQVPDGGPLTTGHIECVLHATRNSDFPAGEVAAVRAQTRAPIVVVASAGEAAAMLEQALENDVSDVLLLPQLTHSVVFAIRKAAHVRRQFMTPTRAAGRIVTVFSPKGGTGKTVVSTNLAVALAKSPEKRTLLLDLDLQFGDAAITLGMEPEKTIYDLVSAPGELDPEKLAGYVTKHPCGLDVLAAPLRPEDAELVVESKVTALLEVARASYDVIIVDTSPFFHGAMLATLDRTDELIVLCGLDVPTLKNIRLALQTLELLSFPASRIRYVMNRVNPNVGLKTREVEAGLKVKISTELPVDRAVQVCVNRGEPIVLAERRSEFAKAICALAAQVGGPAPSKRAEHKRRLAFARA